MTTIQIFALIGVFLIGAIFGGYGMYKFFKFAIRHCTVVGLEVMKCAKPECDRWHLQLNVENPTKSLGVSGVLLEIEPKVAEALVGFLPPTQP